ncbi:MAG TPA: MFS transporter [Chloroflexota bacterium]|nr:MFS transporter [Chloroflexota bacterium]
MGEAATTVIAPRTVSRGRTTLWGAYLAGSLGVGAFNGFNNFTLSLWLSGFTTSYLLINLLANTRSFEGAVVAPLVGAWSDRTWLGWLGRRRPFILVGGTACGLLLAATPYLAGWADPGSVGLVRLLPTIVAIYLFTLSFNVMDDLHKALLADVTVGPARTRLASLHVVVMALGQVLILVVGAMFWRSTVPDWAFALAGGIVLVGAVANVLWVQEPPALGHSAARGRPTLRSMVAIERRALLFCLANLCYWTGANAIVPLLSLFARDLLGASVGQAQLMPGMLLIASTICALPCAWLANRWGKRRVLAAGYLIVVASALAAMVITTTGEGMATFALAGIGSAAVLVLPVPIVSELVSRDRVGAAVGVLAGGGSIAAPLAALLAGGVADAFGLRAVFAIMVVAALSALAILPFTQAGRNA